MRSSAVRYAEEANANSANANSDGIASPGLAVRVVASDRGCSRCTDDHLESLPPDSLPSCSRLRTFLLRRWVATSRHN